MLGIDHKVFGKCISLYTFYVLMVMNNKKYADKHWL